MAREIRLSDNFDYVAIVDDEDYSFLIQWRWTFKRSSRKNGQGIYACRNTTTGSRKRRLKVMMHNIILDRKGDPRPTAMHTAHHINRDSLDNTRGNLIWETKSEQTRASWETRRENRS